MPITLPGGIAWPFGRYLFGQGTSNITLDATGEKWAIYGRIYFQGRASGVKTLDATGLSQIRIRNGNSVWSTAGTTVRVGLQTVNTSAGPPMQPDGTWLLSKTLVQGVDTVTNSAWNNYTPDFGTVNLSHGDEVCIVADMTVRNGADVFLVIASTTTSPAYGFVNISFPLATAFLTGAWVQSGMPFIVLRMSDGTLGFIDSIASPASTGSTSWQDSTNPDERAVVFQVPFNSRADALWTGFRSTAAGSDGVLTLYSDPFGTPTALATITILAEPGSATNTNGLGVWVLNDPVSLSANTDYCVALRATGASTLRNEHITLLDSLYRETFPAGTTVSAATRNDGSGAFTPTGTATTEFPSMGVRLCEIPDGGGGLGGFPLSRIVA